MAKLIFLKIRGKFQEGFDVTLQISRGEGEAFSIGIDSQLPQTSADIPASYDKLQKNYSYLRRCLPHRKSQRFGVRISGSEQDLAQLRENCRSSYKNLIKELQSWLSQYECIEYRNLKERLIQELGDSQGRGEEVRFFIQTNDDLLNRLPWHEWDIFTVSKTKCEVAISPSNFDQVQRVKISPKSTMRILAILGDSTGLNIEEECGYLQESFPGAEVCFLSEPTREVISDRLGYEDWDILFFAGHSNSEDGKGKIRTNPREYLTIENLKPGLRDAIERGLKLAIFNSCDGLQLAYDLAELHIPQLIVMREPVPDKVAQRFLYHFLKAFSEKQESLYQAVGKARRQLQTEGLEDKFPGAAWMPIICQNPAEPSLVWSTSITQEDTKNQLLAETHSKISVANFLYEQVIYIYKYLNLTKTSIIVIITILTATIMIVMRDFNFPKIGELPIFGENQNNEKIGELPIFGENQNNEQKFNDTQLLPKSNIDYTNLESLLATKQFGKADEETWDIMLQVADRKDQGNLRIKDIQNFPCQDLRTIDNLWRRYSDRRFGFSVQRQIYRELAQTGGFEGEMWKAFGDNMGWRQNGNWLSQNQLNLETDAKNMSILPVGHFPQRPGHLNSHWDLYPRIEACEI